MTSGPDEIPAFVVKDCAALFSYPLTVIFNLSLRSHTFPNAWKTSKICPVFKQGKKCDISNYRPISIICNFCKVFESLLFDRIYSHVSNAISPAQHGFMKKRSTISNLYCITQHLAETINQGSQTDVIYTDLSKAFDKINHSILLHKFDSFGFSAIFIKFFESYLTNRTQYVSLNGFKSLPIHATSGVPQGSVLGPLFFNIFINDIALALDCNYLVYADDLKIYTTITTVDDCNKLQVQLSKVYEWCSENHLSLNIGKCQVISYTTKTKPLHHTYRIGTSILNRPETFKDLGVTFDSKLSFRQHIQSITANSFKTLGFIIRCSRNISDIDAIKSLYYAFIRSRLEYASTIWSPNYNVHTNTLENIQRRFLKYLSFKLDNVYPPIGTPHAQLLEKFNFSSLHDRRTRGSLVFLHKVVHNDIDCTEIVQDLQLYVPKYSSRNPPTFYLPAQRTNALKFSPLHTMCNNYNLRQEQFDIFNSSRTAIKQLGVVTNI